MIQTHSKANISREDNGRLMVMRKSARYGRMPVSHMSKLSFSFTVTRHPTHKRLFGFSAANFDAGMQFTRAARGDIQDSAMVGAPGTGTGTRTVDDSIRSGNIRCAA